MTEPIPGAGNGETGSQQENTADRVRAAFGPPIDNQPGTGQASAPEPTESDEGAQREFRQATAEEKSAILLRRRSWLNENHKSLVKKWQSLHPTQPLISLVELARLSQDQTEAGGRSPKELADIERKRLADMIFNSQLFVQEAEEYLNTFSKEDRSKIEASLLEMIKKEMQEPQVRIGGIVPGETVQFNTDPEWLEDWKAYYPQLNEKPRNADLVNAIKDKASGIKVFGGTLLGFTGHLIGNTVDYTLHHKSEILAGMVFGGGARIATRLAVHALGGWAVAAAAGAVGGAFSGGAKEYFKQRKTIDIGEREKALIIGGLKNEFRRMSAANKGKVAKAFGTGAIFGLFGGVAGGEIAEWLANNEAVQGFLSPVKEGVSRGLSDATQWVQEHIPNTSKPGFGSTTPTPTEGPAGTPTPVRLPGPVVSPTTEPPVSVTPVPTATEAVPTITSTPAIPTETAGLTPTPAPAEAPTVTLPPTAETIFLPKGSNPWTAVKGYLEQSLGREPSGSEIQEAVNRVLAENNIVDAHNVPAGNLKVHEVNEYIQQLRGGQPLPAAPEEIANIQAAEVGKYLPVRDEITNEALKSQGLSNAEVDFASFAKGQEAVQRIMEAKANEIHDSMAAAFDQAYADWVNSEAGRRQLLEASAKAVQDQLLVEHNLAGKITDALKDNPGVLIEKGATAGEILHLGWQPTDAPVMGANIAANYDMLKDMRAQTAQVHPDLLPNANFPVSLSEINDLVKRAEAGDELAIRRLRQALHWIPAGSRFKVIAGNQIQAILKMVA